MRNLLNKYLTGASLIALTFSLSTNTANATCSAMPTCSELGYNRTSCDSGQESIKCPFDTTKVVCYNVVSADCYGLGYTESRSDCPNENYIRCPMDDTMVKCLPLLPYKVGDIYYYEGRVVGIIYDIVETSTYYDLSLLAPSDSVDYQEWLYADIDDIEELIEDYSGDLFDFYEAVGMCTDGVPENASGKQLTQAILDNCGDPYMTQAANGFYYQHHSCHDIDNDFCSDGKWWLPSETETLMALENDAVVEAYNSLHDDSEHKISYRDNRGHCVGNGICDFWTSSEYSEYEAISYTRYFSGNFTEATSKDYSTIFIPVTKIRINK